MQHLLILLLVITYVPHLRAEEGHRISSQATQDRLQQLVSSAERPEKQKQRDEYRHPYETLVFFGIEPGMTVVEIWPGGQGGFYRRILAPLLEAEGEYRPIQDDRFPDDTFAGDADMLLVFRAHGFMIYDLPVQQYFDTLYKMLRPGGTFGIVDHRGDERIPQDPKGKNGYVNQSHVLTLARKAGFELIAQSEINANPRDTKDHPEGLYSLPPTLKGSTFDRSARSRFLAIGESDRMTLKFRKPQ